jgi:hypothetical protein
MSVVENALNGNTHPPNAIKHVWRFPFTKEDKP